MSDSSCRSSKPISSFSLDLLFRRISVAAFERDGTSGRVTQRFQVELAEAGYPADWLLLVVCRFASKEVVDRDYEGSYYYYVR